VLALAPIIAQADWMTDFYDAAGAGSNTTMGQAVHTQTAVGFAGGGVSWRVPDKTITPLSITPPMVKAGCSGIDAYLGSYSFVNKTQFVNALRNFGQAATGYFFELALRSMAPEIAVTLDAINDIAQKINAMSAGSCETARWAAGSLASKVMGEGRQANAGYVQAMGSAVDFFDGLLGNQSGSDNYTNAYMARYGKTQSAVTDADVKKECPPLDRNILYWAIQNSGLDFSDAETSLVMSIIGPSGILKVGTDSSGDASTSTEGFGDTVSLQDLVGKPNTVGTISLLTCANPECTQLGKASQPINNFAYLAKQAMLELDANIKARSATAVASLSGSAQLVVRLASVPLLRVVSLANTQGPLQATALSMYDDFAEYAGTEAMLNFVSHYMTAVNRALATTSDKCDTTQIEMAQRLQHRTMEVLQLARDYTKSVYTTRGDPFEKITQLETLERAAFANMNVQLAANFRFTTR
jgi:conjugative transfer pilus assembly protein TraH